MNNPLEQPITETIKAANLYSISGLLREFVGEDYADIMLVNVEKQVSKQLGYVPSEGKLTYHSLENEEVKFTVPVQIVGDIASFMVKARDEVKKGHPSPGMSNAIKVLMNAWHPFVMSAADVVFNFNEKDQSHGDEFLGPESMN